ncbi:MAG: sugar phosphate isomerase/epimerase family protein [Phycisphaerae bacterium]
MLKAFSRVAVVASSLSDDLHAVPEVARRAGFSGVLLEAADPAFVDLSATGAREVRTLLGRFEQPLVGLAMHLGRDGLRPGGDLDRVLARVERALQVARLLQATMLTVDVGRLPAPARVEAPRPTASDAGLGGLAGGLAGSIIVPRPEDVPAGLRADGSGGGAGVEGPADPAFSGRVAEGMAQLGVLADRYSVLMAFSSQLASYAALSSAVEQAACPSFGYDLDPVALVADPAEAEAVFGMLVGPILHVRGRDGQRGDAGRTRLTPVGKGEVQWGRLAGLLDDAGYHGFVSVDTRGLTNEGSHARQARAFFADF